MIVMDRESVALGFVVDGCRAALPLSRACAGGPFDAIAAPNGRYRNLPYILMLRLIRGNLNTHWLHRGWEHDNVGYTL